MTTTTKPRIAPGHAKPFPVPGTRIVVTLANNSRGTWAHWNVDITCGGARVDRTSRAFDGDTAEDDARTYARAMVREYHAEAVELRRAELARYLAEQDARRARGMHDRAGVKAAEAELAEMEGDDLRALRDRLRAQFNGLNEAA